MSRSLLLTTLNSIDPSFLHIDTHERAHGKTRSKSCQDGCLRLGTSSAIVKKSDALGQPTSIGKTSFSLKKIKNKHASKTMDINRILFETLSPSSETREGYGR